MLSCRKATTKAIVVALREVARGALRAGALSADDHHAAAEVADGIAAAEDNAAAAADGNDSATAGGDSAAAGGDDSAAAGGNDSAAAADDNATDGDDAAAEDDKTRRVRRRVIARGDGGHRRIKAQNRGVSFARRVGANRRRL